MAKDTNTQSLKMDMRKRVGANNQAKAIAYNIKDGAERDKAVAACIKEDNAIADLSKQIQTGTSS